MVKTGIVSSDDIRAHPDQSLLPRDYPQKVKYDQADLQIVLPSSYTPYHVIVAHCEDDLAEQINVEGMTAGGIYEVLRQWVDDVTPTEPHHIILLMAEQPEIRQAVNAYEQVPPLSHSFETMIGMAARRHFQSLASSTLVRMRDTRPWIFPGYEGDEEPWQ